jgi:beta-galactosidase GanA
MQAMIDDLGVRQFRLVSYWDKIEPEKGTYDFDELDWQFQKANDAHAKVSLAIGLRQPRWPECHMPSWQIGKPMSELLTSLL